MKIGAHESVAGGVAKAVERAVADGCESLQVFVKSPNRWAAPAVQESDITEFKVLSSKFGPENITAHAAYLINLASPKEDVREKSVAGLKDEMSRCGKFGIPYYVLHPGSPLDSGLEAGMAGITAGVNELYAAEEIDVMLLFEITAGAGTTIGGRLEDLQKLCESVKYPDKVGLCLDTCHMFSAGYDIVDNYEKILTEVNSRFGDKLKVFHLNDSKFEKGARKDRHECIGKGSIGIETFRRLVNDKRLANVLGILETPVGDDETYRGEVNLLKSIREGK